jgi:hypothetical protein
MARKFSDLPAELRIHIWGLALFPRMVPVRTVVADKPHTHIICVKSCIPTPPIVQVCRESRHYARYQRAFTLGSHPRYTWINWEYDMIFCQWENEIPYIRALGQHVSEVQRLHLTHLSLDKSMHDRHGRELYDDV